ncbi:MAG: sigma-70 family RNA polymerase sigma factor [Myxococcota bacterium]
MASTKADALAQELETLRPELLGYLRRMVVRTALAEDLLQSTAERALGSLGSVPEDRPGARRWLFRIATNLALDALRSEKRWSTTMLADVEAEAKSSPWFRVEVQSLGGDPQMATMAREHLAICLGCTLRAMNANEAAALLLREVYGFSLEESAEVLEVRVTQVKNWLQQARATLRKRYAETCALVSQTGACHQCEQLSRILTGTAEDPLAGTDRSLDARLVVISKRRRQRAGPWTSVFDRLVRDVVG